MIRKKLISRKEAVDIVKKIEGKFPQTYMGKSIEDILKKINLPLKEFHLICEKFTNKKIFKTNQAGLLVYDEKGNLEKKSNY